MPIVIAFLLALAGLGYFAREELKSAPAPVVVAAAPRMEAAANPWARACQHRLIEAARDFEHVLAPGCAGAGGTVIITQLPSGVDYVEYNFRSPEGVDYQVSITEEPQNEGEPTGWFGAPGCKGYDRGFEVVRHENGRLARAASAGGHGLEFGRALESAANFCIEQAE